MTQLLALHKLQTLPSLVGYRNGRDFGRSLRLHTIHRWSDVLDTGEFQYLYLTGWVCRACSWMDHAYKRQSQDSSYHRPSWSSSSTIMKFLFTSACSSFHHIQDLRQVLLPRDLYEQIQFRTRCPKSLHVPPSGYASFTPYLYASAP